jgi:preprotein translocase subunit SecF
MKILVLTLLLIIPGLIFAGNEHLIIQNGFLYSIEPDGNWYFKGKASENQMSESQKREANARQQWWSKQEVEAARQEAAIRAQVQAEELRALAQAEREQAQADRDEVQREIEMDLSDIATALELR